MPRDALRTILPVAGWSADAGGRGDIHRRHRPGHSDAVPRRRGRRRDPGRDRTCRLRAVGNCAPDGSQYVAVDLRQATASLRSGHYMKLGDGEVSHARNTIMGVYPTKDGRWSYLHCNFPNHRAAALQRARRGGGSCGGGARRAELERRRSGGGDHRRQRRGRHGADAGRVGAASAGRRHRRLAAAGDRADRRRPAGAAARRASGRCRAFACST